MMRIEECAGGFVVAETCSNERVLYYGRFATASRTDMLLKDEVFPTLKEAEHRMFEMGTHKAAAQERPSKPLPQVMPSHDQTMEGCMGPEMPNRNEVIEAMKDVLATLRDDGLLEQDEGSLAPSMAECRRRVLWLLEKAVEEVLWQDACENF